MERNLDLMHEILLGIIKNPAAYSSVINLHENRKIGIALGVSGDYYDDLENAGYVLCLDYPGEEIDEHLALLEDATLVQAGERTEVGISYRATNDGHDYVLAMEQPGLWNKVQRVAESSGMIFDRLPIRQILELMQKNWFTS